MFAEDRNLTPFIIKDLQKKYVFLAGPRQVGKTTLAKKLIKKLGGNYLLYDDDDDRKIILEKSFTHQKLVCLDEFHKYNRWKHFLKGIYDKYHETCKVLLTGSARLDIYQKSGDSLFGRYYLHHLHPYSLSEINGKPIPELPKILSDNHEPLKHVEALLNFSGFPEPLFAQNKREHLRWSNARRTLLMREDLRDISDIHLISLVEQLMLLLPKRVGSMFSFRSLAEDIRVSPVTIKNWLNVLTQLFIVFEIKPYSKNIARSIQKAPKFYLYDWSQIDDDPGARFENFIASHLFKAAQTWTDLGYGNISLHFVRDRDGREVDFLLCNNNKPWFLIECKLAETQLAPNLAYYSEKFQIPGVQLILSKNFYKQMGRNTIISCDQWLGKLP